MSAPSFTETFRKLRRFSGDAPTPSTRLAASGCSLPCNALPAGAAAGLEHATRPARVPSATPFRSPLGGLLGGLWEAFGGLWNLLQPSDILIRQYWSLRKLLKGFGKIRKLPDTVGKLLKGSNAFASVLKPCRTFGCLRKPKSWSRGDGIFGRHSKGSGLHFKYLTIFSTLSLVPSETFEAFGNYRTPWESFAST